MPYVLRRPDHGNGNRSLRWIRTEATARPRGPSNGAVPNGSIYTPTLRSALEHLDELVGLHRVKEVIRETAAYHCVQDRRSQMGLLANPTVLHMIFSGNPGTGKTTVARLLGPILREVGALKTGHLVEAERADLVGEYIGHTAQKTRQIVRQAAGGILFVDEAYSLARGGDKDFGREAIDLLVKAMEDMKEDMVLILAGYGAEMRGFIGVNPGLKSRFPLHLHFPDFSAAELELICHQMLDQRQYRLTAAASEHLAGRLRAAVDERRPAGLEGNARFVRNLVERTVRRQSLRLVQEQGRSRDDYMSLMRCDVEEGFRYCLSESGPW